MTHKAAALVLYSVGIGTDTVLEAMIDRMEHSQLRTSNLTKNDLVKDHLRHLMGGRSNVENERLYRFTFPDRLGALMKFLDVFSLFHSQNRPVTDYNVVALHFIQCIHVHLENNRQKVGGPTQFQSNPVMGFPMLNEVKRPETPIFKKTKVSEGSESDIYKLVLGVFMEPASLASDHGVHVDEVVRIYVASLLLCYHDALQSDQWRWFHSKIVI